MSERSRVRRERRLFEPLERRELLTGLALLATVSSQDSGAPAAGAADVVSLGSGATGASFPAPTVAKAASASAGPITGTSASLSVLGAYAGGESNLTYTWSVMGNAPAPVSFGANGTNAAKNTTVAFTTAGVYNFTVTIADQNGLSTTSSLAVQVTYGQFTTSGDIGAPALAGSLNFNVSSAAYTVTAGGTDIWDPSDQFRFSNESFSGNGQFTARVSSISNSNSWAKAGVMFRADSSNTAAYADVMATPGQGVTFQWRATAGGASSFAVVTGITAPVWVRLVRAGNLFTGYYSTNGTSWTQIGTTQTVVMAAAVQAGLAVSSHNAAALTTAVIDNVTLSGLAVRGRATLNAARTTFVADDGQLLRGPFTSTEWTGAIAESDLAMVKPMGFNAIHLYGESFDSNYPNAGSTAPGYAAARIDQIVQEAQDLGLYVILTIGNGANNGDYNLQYDQDFWKFYAPRYANATNVLFEIQNEPVAWGPPYSSGSATPPGALAMEESVYTIIRTYAPSTPVLLFTYAVFGGTGGASAALQDIHAFNQAIFGNQNAIWTNEAVAFHGYAGDSGTASAVQALLSAGYPAVMTEFTGGMWGGQYGGLDVTLTESLEQMGVSWMTFEHVPPTGVAASVTDTNEFVAPVEAYGLGWTPDYGNWPAARGTYGNGNAPWTTTSTYVSNQLTGTLHIEAENYDVGGQNVAYYDSTPGNQGGLYRPNDSVDITAANDFGGGYAVSSTTSGEYLEYTINVPQPGYYNLALRYSSGVAGASVDVTSQFVDLAGVLPLPSTGGVGNWSTFTVPIFLGQGQQVLHIGFPVGGVYLNWLELTPVLAGALTNGTYLLVNRNSGLAMQFDTTNNVVVQQPVTPGSNLQQWTLQNLGAGQYKITSVSNGNTWNSNGGTSTTSLGALGMTANWGLNGSQMFILQPTSDGFFNITTVNNGYGLDILNGSTAAGAGVVQDLSVASANQQWAIIAATDQIFPGGLTAYRDSTGHAQLSWNAAAGAASYNIKRSATSGGPYATIATGVTGKSYVDNTALQNATYYYVVSAVSATGSESRNSGEAGLALPRAQLEFNEGAGTTAADSTGNGWTGTLQNGAAWSSAGVSGSALLLNGSGAYVTLPTGVVNGLTDFTISTWVNLTTNPSWSRIFDFGTGTGNYMYLSANANNSGALRFAINNGSGEQDVNGGTVPLGTWTNVAVALAGGVATVYVNGQAVASASITLTPSSLGATNQNYLGKSQYNDPYLNGKMDDIRIYASGLSASQIASLYLAGLAPSVALSAAANPAAVTAKSTQLSVLGTDNGGESILTYTWYLVNSPGAVSFSDNGTNSAKNTTATFSAAGTYNFMVAITDPSGFTASSGVTVTVAAVPASISVAPAATPVSVNGSQQFGATEYDQFGAAVAAQPGFTWTVANGGSISSAGLYSAPAAPATATVQAAAGALSGTALVTVTTQASPTIVNPAAASPAPAGTSAALSVLGASAAGEANLTYTWSLTGTPPASVSFSVNGTNAAKNATAKFTKSGIYNFTVTIVDQVGLTITSSVSVTVNFGMFTDSGDIGAPALAGSMSYNASGGVYTVTAGGSDIWNASDQFRYSYESYSGTGQMTARVTSVSNTNASAKAGVMFRDSSAANAAYAFVWVSPGNNAVFETRSANGVSSNYSLTVAAGGSPVWVRLVRSGVSDNQFTAYYSRNGTTWTQVGTTQTVTMATSAVVGLAVTSHNAGSLNTSVLDNVSVSALPAVTSIAWATPMTDGGTNAQLTVQGSDPSGEANLTYAWTMTSGPAAVSFSANGTNASKVTVVTFSKAGSYSFQATLTNSAGLSTTSSVSVTVIQTFTSIAVSPGTANVSTGGTRQFSATADDQFGAAMSTQPAFTWSLASGVGSVSSAALYTASFAAGSASVRATSGLISGTAVVTVTNAAPTIAAGAAGSPSPVTGTATNLTVLGADDAGESNLSYTWATTGTPPAAVSFSVNGTNAAKSAVATFTKAGNYAFQVTITDAGGLATTSSLNLTVNQTPTALTVQAVAPLWNSGSVPLSATVLDQFGMLINSPGITWSKDSGSGMVAGATYTAPASGPGSAVIRATAGNATNTVAITTILSVIAASVPGSTIRLARDSGDASKLDVFINSASVPTYSAILAQMDNLQVSGAGGVTTFILDFSNGDPLPVGMPTLDGTGGTSAILQVTGPATAFPLTLANGAFTSASGLALTGLSLTGDASLALASGGANTLSVTSLNIDPGARLDLSDNNMVIESDSPAAALVALTPYLAAGRNGGDWNGLGVFSSAAHAQYLAHGASEYTGLAAAINGTLPVMYASSFANVSVTSESVLVKYTYAGDATLDGLLNIDDVLAAEDGLLFGRTGYVNGGFDYGSTANWANLAILNANISRQNGIQSVGGTAVGVTVPATNAQPVQQDSDPAPVAAVAAGNAPPVAPAVGLPLDVAPTVAPAAGVVVPEISAPVLAPVVAPVLSTAPAAMQPLPGAVESGTKKAGEANTPGRAAKFAAHLPATLPGAPGIGDPLADEKPARRPAVILLPRWVAAVQAAARVARRL